MSDLRSALMKFAECDHKYWTCNGCGCTADVGTIASPYRAEVVRLEDENERLKAASDRPLGDPEIGLEIMRLERDEARKAARSLLTAAEELSVFEPHEIVEAALAKWPWLHRRK